MKSVSYLGEWRREQGRKEIVSEAEQASCSAVRTKIKVNVRYQVSNRVCGAPSQPAVHVQELSPWKVWPDCPPPSRHCRRPPPGSQGAPKSTHTSQPFSLKQNIRWTPPPAQRQNQFEFNSDSINNYLIFINHCSARPLLHIGRKHHPSFTVYIGSPLK